MNFSKDLRLRILFAGEKFLFEKNVKKKVFERFDREDKKKNFGRFLESFDSFIGKFSSPHLSL